MRTPGVAVIFEEEGKYLGASGATECGIFGYSLGDNY